MSRGEGVQGIQTMHVDISQIGCQVALINKFITSLSLYHNLSVVTSQPAQAQPKTDAVIFSVVLDREGSNLGIRLEGTYNQFTVYVLLEFTCQYMSSLK